MEVPVKERLTGALILIAVLVIVVPEMLSGPDHAAPTTQPAEAGPPVRTYRLQLDTAAARSQDQSTLSPKPAVEAPAQPVPQAEPPEAVSAPVAPASVSTEQKPAPASVSAPKPTAALVKDSLAVKPAAAGQWWAQLGSFASRDNAERLTKELREAGYSVNLARVQAGGKDLYRVRAGPAPSREAVATLQAKLAAAGHKSSLVAP